MYRVRLLVLVVWLSVPALGLGSSGGREELGPNVHLFDARMSVGEIQAAVDAIAARQMNNHFGEARDAILFEPGVYGSREHPLRIKLGYYTSIAGLGAKPTEVVIHGLIEARNRCFKGECLALDNFWRSLSNLTLSVVERGPGCESGNVFAVSQAAPVRRLKVTEGTFKLSDFCTQPSWASGGFIADSMFDGEVSNGAQQQYLVRNSRLRRWTGGVWNQVFAGVEGDVPVCAGENPKCAYFSLPSTSETREAPYLFREAAGRYAVAHPGVRWYARGVSWDEGGQPGKDRGESLSLGSFYIAQPGDGAARINAALTAGKNLLLTPGVYRLSEALSIKRAGTVVLGLGFPTLMPERGGIAMEIAASHGIAIAGILFDAGEVESPVLLRVGDEPGALRGPRAGPNVAHAPESVASGDPISLHDVFFRVGGAHVGKAVVSLEVNANHVILDHIWAWRADHGEGVGWDKNTADSGLVVRGDHVTAYGLFVEHYQKHEVLWSGEDGTLVFLQNEMPYDPPDQGAWRAGAGHDGYDALKVTEGVRRFRGYGLGSYTYFNRGVPIFAEHAFEVPAGLAKASLQDAFTIFLNAKASGGIRQVVNDRGGASTVANPDVAVRVPSYP